VSTSPDKVATGLRERIWVFLKIYGVKNGIKGNKIACF
jgi:hypothetical protein